MKKAYLYYIKINQSYGIHHHKALCRVVAIYIAIVLYFPTPVHAHAPSIITNSWTLAETLIALDSPPQAIAMTEDYETWGHDNLPTEVKNIGLIQQPNLELIAQLSPHLFLTEEYFRLDERIAQRFTTLTLPQHDRSVSTWEGLVLLTQEVSASANTHLSHEELLNEYEAKIDNLKERLENFISPLLIIYILDDRHVRVFGEGSLVHTMLEKLGITNAWNKPTSRWGFSVVTTDELINIDAQLVIIKKPGAYNNFNPQNHNSGLWGYIPSIKNGTAISTPPFWMFGGLPSAYQFASNLVDSLERN
ncbi:ABC transporter substrate-binding protein [Halomonas sp. SpR8]|uniref:ABC transporter substrate-binding protein n=1 Tax=Halomonas sp. SpR8 TaxID=3050463 RepID=UPI0027E4E98D|nr:ABC transporter substrate-binding protein [Halomonas sp. SpR8]MDQ7727804.1 ABC transporter substrate-binding protein [Halomonas sp. SpR8]